MTHPLSIALDEYARVKHWLKMNMEYPSPFIPLEQRIHRSAYEVIVVHTVQWVSTEDRDRTREMMK